MSSENAVEILELWRLRALRSARAHYGASQRFRQLDLTYTIANVASSILVLVLGLAIQYVHLPSYVIGGVLPFASAIVVITSTCQYVLNYGRSSIEHGQAGAKYSAALRKIESIRANSEYAASLTEIRHLLDELGEWCPVVPKHLWQTQPDIEEKIQKIEASFRDPEIQDAP